MHTCVGGIGTTVKVTNDNRPLVLDDEFAFVHLGRFIEIVHSRSYQDHIELGIGLKNVEYQHFVREKSEKDQKERAPELKTRKGDIKATYRFKCTKRTQEINVETATLSYGDVEVVARNLGDGDYALTMSDGSGIIKITTRMQSAFFISQSSIISAANTPDEYFRFFSFIRIQDQIREELSKILYLGPFRQGPLRRYPTRGAGPTEVGSMGEATITMLANETIQSSTRKHIKQVASWLKDLGLAQAIDVSRIGRSDLFDVAMTLKDGESFPIADLGYGLSQVLPVLVQCSFAPKGATLLFEQPEIHLHSIPTQKLAKVFIDTANRCGATIVIETHSPELVKAFMVAQRKDKTIKPEDFVVYRVVREKGESVTKSIEFDEDLNVYENWEKGISVE